MRKPRTQDDKWYQKTSEEYDKVKITCKCGHRVIIPHWVKKQICDWCGNYVYRDKKLEFQEKLKKELKKNGH